MTWLYYKHYNKMGLRYETYNYVPSETSKRVIPRRMIGKCRFFYGNMMEINITRSDVRLRQLSQ